MQFDAGDKILLSTQNLHLLGSKKLQKWWLGLLCVVCRVINVAYTLDLDGKIQGVHLTFHISLL